MKRQRLDYRRSVPIPLIIVAGLPNAVAPGVRSHVKQCFHPVPNVIAHPSGNANDRLYKPETVDRLLVAVTGYAERRIFARAAEPCPEYILLAYVPSEDEDQLLREFEYFAFPVRLSNLATYNESGRQIRHEASAAKHYVLDSLEIALREFQPLKRKLSNISNKEPLLLPPGNFQLEKNGRCLADVFSDLVRQKLLWHDEIAAITRVQVTSEDLPHKIQKGRRALVLQDCRGLLFPYDRTQHGVPRELPNDCPRWERALFMKSVFRFGAPLPEGFHHDAQYPGKNLRGEHFQCCREGSLVLDGTHANIYPNDFVRAAKQ